MSKPGVLVTAFWSRVIGERVEVLAEINGQWRLVSNEYIGPVENIISHIAECTDDGTRWPVDPVTEQEPAG